MQHKLVLSHYWWNSWGAFGSGNDIQQTKVHQSSGRYLQKRVRANGNHHTEELSCKYLTWHKYQKRISVAEGWFKRKISITSSSYSINLLNKLKLHQDQWRQVPVLRNTPWPPVFLILMPAISSISWNMQNCLCCFSGQAWCLSCEQLWVWRDVPLELTTSSCPRDIKMNIKSEL